MALPIPRTYRLVHPAIAGQNFLLGQIAWHWRPQASRRRYATETSTHQTSAQDSGPPPLSSSSKASSSASQASNSSSSTAASSTSSASSTGSSQTNPDKSPRQQDEIDENMPDGWEDTASNISTFSDLPSRSFGFNQHMIINAEFKEALRQVLWRFRAPIRYAFAYGSGVFPQSKTPPDTMPPSPHPNAPDAVKKWQTTGEKNIDFIFGVSHTQHWHSLNLNEHRDHYSFLGSLGSGVIKRVQDNMGAGAYFNPYVTVNGMSIKYGVVNLDTLSRDLFDWETLYLAGRLQKPVKILRDDPKIRLANQINLISALRTALLCLPARFTERDLYFRIAGLSYIGDPRMQFRAERPDKVFAIVDSQMPNFRQLYQPLVANLPNVRFADPATSHPGWLADASLNCALEQDMDPARRGNMVRRLPTRFRRRLYDHFRGVLGISPDEFRRIVANDDGTGAGTGTSDTMARRSGGDFDRAIGSHASVGDAVAKAVKDTVMWPTVAQSFKGILTAGPAGSWKYLSEKRAKGRVKASGASEEKKTEEEKKGEGEGTQSKEASEDSDKKKQ